MVVDYSDVMSVGGLPCEDQTPTIVDSDAVEALEVSLEELKSIPRGRTKVTQVPRGVQHVELL